MAVPDDRDQYSGGDLLEIDPNSREESCRSPKWVKKMLAKNTAM
jgi:hypothetical protein